MYLLLKNQFIVEEWTEAKRQFKVNLKLVKYPKLIIRFLINRQKSIKVCFFVIKTILIQCYNFLIVSAEPSLEKESSNDIIICTGSDIEEDSDEMDEPDKRLSRNLPQFRNVLERGLIPDAKVIYELKKQRQKLARAVNEEFIPLNDEDDETLNTNGEPKDDDDDDKSEDGDYEAEEENDRIQFGSVNYQTKEREKVKETFRLVQEEMDEIDEMKQKSKSINDDDSYSDEDTGIQSDNSEDELERWEREKIRKAVCLPALYADVEFQQRTLVDNHNNKTGSKIDRFLLGEDNHNVVPIEIDNRYGTHIPAYIKDRSTQDDENFQMVHDRKVSIRRKLVASLEDNRKLLDRTSMDLKLNTQNISEFNYKKTSMEQDSIFYKNMLDFVHNLCDCINDKLELIEKYEKLAMDALEECSIKMREKIQIDIQNQNSLCVQFIGTHKDNCAYQHDNNCQNLSDYLEFGFDYEKKNWLLQKEESNRKLLSMQMLNVDITEYEIILEDKEACLKKLKEIKEKVDLIFEDTDDNYALLPKILAQFETWKQTRIDTYSESFVDQFIPKIIVYYIRNELILWNPFDFQTKQSIFEHKFIQHLLTCNHLECEPDIDLIPTIIDTVVLPRIQTLIEKKVWNPLSVKQTLNIVHIINSILSTCPLLVDSSINLPLLFKSIVTELENCISKDIFIPYMVPSDFFIQNKTRSQYESLVTSFATTFFHQQLWQSINLLENIISFQGLISDQKLKTLALDSLLNSCILVSISICSNDHETIVNQLEHIILILPNSWKKTIHPALTKLNNLVESLQRKPDMPNHICKKLNTLKISFDK